MSIDIDWQTLTTGPEGLALAESIKDFVHDKFQQVELPRFIRSVQVHSFDFGKECPFVELKDICDPLPEFYENNEDGDEGEDDGNQHGGARLAPLEDVRRPINMNGFPLANSILPATSRPSLIDPKPTGLRSSLVFPDHFTTPFLSRSNTPGIPGGTSNLSYFHLPLGAGLSGSQTPLAAVAGGTSFSAGWDHHGASLDAPPRPHQHHDLSYPDPSSRPSTAESYQKLQNSDTRIASDESEPASCGKCTTPDPMDTQIVLHISYAGTVCLSMTVEILLDYPMPSFVGIPLKLNVTGLSFDGVALFAHLRKRAHFCFLNPDDAQTLVGVEGHSHQGKSGTHEGGGHTRDGGKERMGGLLREIQVESEIGRKEGGKQVLKNVGKVEKFVLEQVRRIFEEEFVWPSFWTFLL